LALALDAFPLHSALAQSSGKQRPAANREDVRSTIVEIQIVSDDGGALRAQEWRAALEPLDVSFSIRRASDAEEPETKERIVGTLRRVTAVGRLDRSGRLTFADRVFEPGERRKLKAWVDDLKTYGAQGSPDGKPLWGLTEEQFSALYESVTAVTQTDDRGKPLEDAVRGLPIPAEYPLQWSAAARKRLSALDRKPVVRQRTEGFAVATALAVMLNDAGFGFLPHRTPSGKLELLIDVPQEPSQVWPIGWPLKLPRQKAAPKLFELKRIFVDDRTVADVLDLAAETTEVPVLFDYAELDRLGADWASQSVLYAPRQATWHTVLKDVLNKQKLTFDLWQDEIGRPFLLVTTVKSKRGSSK
jgi:hypothetical protein